MRSPASRAYVDRLVVQVEKRVQAVGPSAGPVGAVLVAALGLADDLHRAGEALEATQVGVRAQSEQLLTQIHALMDTDGS